MLPSQTWHLVSIISFYSCSLYLSKLFHISMFRWDHLLSLNLLIARCVQIIDLHLNSGKDPPI